jgi:hypothetical protein
VAFDNLATNPEEKLRLVRMVGFENTEQYRLAVNSHLNSLTITPRSKPKRKAAEKDEATPSTKKRKSEKAKETRPNKKQKKEDR